jgi:hypothetical protein
MKRPRTITLVAWIFILVGAAGILADLWPLLTPDASHQIEKLRADGLADLAPAWGLRALAIIGGVGLLGGANWARWLLALWMLAHVGISLLHSLGEVLTHCAIFLPILYCLFRRPIQPFFHASNRPST